MHAVIVQKFNRVENYGLNSQQAPVETLGAFSFSKFEISFLKAALVKKSNSARADSSPDPSSARTKCKKQISLGFAKIQSPENSFRKTESELKPRHLPEYLEGRTPKRKMSFPF